MISLFFYAVVSVCSPLVQYPNTAVKGFVFVRGHTAAVGFFDENGEFKQGNDFVPYGHNRVSGYAVPILRGQLEYPYSQSLTLEGKCYELRSGYLILGVYYISDLDYFFIPELNSTIKKYDPETFENDLYIYNEPVKYRKYWTRDRILQMRNSKQDKIEYKKLSPPKGYLLTLSKNKTNYKKLMKTYKGQVEFGDIDEYGVFCPDYSMPVLPMFQLDKQYRQDYGIEKKFIYSQFNLVQNGKEEEKVYEFRADRLIPGVLKGNTGLFVPTVGEKIISFSDYKVGKDVRIYNLPGFFERKP